MFKVTEKTALLSAFLWGMSYEQVKEDFVRNGSKPVTSKQAIRDAVNKFQRTRNTADGKCSGKPHSVQNRLQAIEDAKIQSPTKSTSDWVMLRTQFFGVLCFLNWRNADTTFRWCTILNFRILQLVRQCVLI